MTDRELLELAAKAAGMDAHYMKSDWRSGMVLNGVSNAADTPWNPLTDDGDALRLAVKLKIVFEQRIAKPNVAVYVTGVCSLEEPIVTDPYAATRRAIVRAAAEIGKGM